MKIYYLTNMSVMFIILFTWTSGKSAVKYVIFIMNLRIFSNALVAPLFFQKNRTRKTYLFLKFP